MRVFLDTNVLVSAFATRGLCADLFELVLFEHDMIVGRNVLRELAKALRQKVKLPPRDVDGIVAFVSGEATQLVESSRAVSESMDADDAIIPGEALAGNAAVFVTGDSRVPEARRGRAHEDRIAADLLGIASVRAPEDIASEPSGNELSSAAAVGPGGRHRLHAEKEAG